MTLVVRIGEEEEVVAEMTTAADSGEFAVVSEMAVTAERVDHFVSGAGAKCAALAERCGDDTPEFPIVRVEEGWSRNNRLWDGQELANIARQVEALEPVGHWGHPNPNTMAWEAPEPQTTWVGATVKQEPSRQPDNKGKMVAVFYAAGYNLPGAKIRGYIKSKSVKGVSWLCGGKQIPVPGKGVQMRDVTLHALDWARKLAEGMPSTGIVAVASEQSEGGMMDKKISQVTPEELRAEAPNLVTLIEDGARREADALVSEMEGKVEAAKGDSTLVAELRTLLGLDATGDLKAAVVQLKTRTGEVIGNAYDAILDAVLGEKIPGDTDEAKRNRSLVRQIMRGPLTVGEMAGAVEGKEEDDAKKAVGEMVDKCLNENDDVKSLVSEMAPPNPSRTGHRRDTSTKAHSGQMVGGASKLS